MHDMGLGFAEGDFEAISDDEYEDLMLEQEVQELLDADVVEISDDDSDKEAVKGEVDEDEEVDVATLGVGQQGAGNRQ